MKAIPLDIQEMVRQRRFSDGQALPLIIEPTYPDMNLTEWLKQQSEWVEKQLLQCGGILFRGFQVKKQVDFHQLVDAICSQPMTYKEGATPRTKISEKVYTSTEFPATQRIDLHNELSYVNTWPKKIWFCCIKNADKGGETPIADVRKVYQLINKKIIDTFKEKGWMLVRNFGDGFGLPWQRVFHTDLQHEVDAYGKENGISREWKDENRLRTTQVRPAIAIHPDTKESLWFNHIVFWHESSLEPRLRTMFHNEFGKDGLPFSTYYGDGTPIEDEVIDEIKKAYRQATITFKWEEGDVLMLDNMLVAHGRNPFEGERKVLVSMGEPVHRQGE
ncbi:TauD/TfdA family dioxygenase [Paenactinomyces guangxiensis]|uniref:TauD/TfdA family dioxygenase n=1 Tax=Paenactinomyces guangxiensis TaxID=1490290 RepID=A0A7W1WSI9_9BACL|nr:TauD/TfdA family dioxygenase [Paenactinomyces guangxiensis]MBA4495179.1 TauD/TfdA family dioxygenase [Paenactinomyces guangxiensis]MBH8592137.1 TauD/TfdA family dioxygenase [Paenactinomyces guangxiensis]